MSENKNETVLNKVRNMIPFDLKKTIAFTAFTMCVSALSAKTVTGKYIGMEDFDKSVKVMKSNGEVMKISDAPKMCEAITYVVQESGADALVSFSFDENTSRLENWTVIQDRISEGTMNGIPHAIDRAGEVVDFVKRVGTNVLNGNINRSAEEIANGIKKVAPFKGTDNGGIVRVKGIAEDGKVYWMQYHTVDRSGNLKPEYYKNKTSANSYSQSTYAKNNSGYTNAARMQSKYYRH